MDTPTKLPRKIDGIGDLSREQLVALWIKTYGHSPPKGIKRPLLERVVAWQVQVRQYGGHGGQTKRTLGRLIAARLPVDAKCQISLRQDGGNRQSNSISEVGAPTNGHRLAADRDSTSTDVGLTPNKLVDHSPASIGASTSESVGAITAKRQLPKTIRILHPGDRLVRDWQGRTYHVEVTHDGFNLDGRSYRSLSAVAKRITGSHWSGPRFFGL